MTKENRTVVFTNMYTAISKATAETTDSKGNVTKKVFSGFVKDLFGEVSTFTVTRFLWAVSHKTDVLPTILFRVTSHGKKGYEIERVHTGFRSQETGKKLIGVELIPYIMEAAKLYKATPRPQKTEDPSQLVYDERTGDFVPKGQLESPVAPEGQLFDCSGTLANTLDAFTDEQLLAELQRREEERKAAEELARKKALVEEFLAAYDLTMDDLLDIAQVI